MNSCIKSILSNSILRSLSKSLVFKLSGALLSFIIIPMSISVLSTEKYGVWSTILSFVSWFTFFDFGLANGLRNKLTEAVSKKKFEDMNKYISTAYVTIGGISSILLIIIAFVFPIINWNKVFNTINIVNNELLVSMLVISCCFIINLVLSNVNAIFYAFQKPELPGLSNVIMQLSFIIFLIIFKRYINGSLIGISLFYGVAIIISNLILTIIFIKRNKEIKIKLTNVEMKYIKSIMELGTKFFIIQLSSLILLTTDNIVITQIIGPQYVTEYSIIYKLFSLVTMFHGGIILNSLWSIYTKKYAEKDYKSIKRTFTTTKKLFLLVVCFIVIITLFHRYILNIWLGSEFEVSLQLVLFMSLYTILVAFNGTFCSILNGVGKIDMQLYISIFAAVINIPVSIFFSKYMGMGSSGVILGSIISLIPGIIILPIQVIRFLRSLGEK